MQKKEIHMKYIYSTLSNDQHFVVWTQTDDAKKLPLRKKTILVHGNANVMNKTTLITPKGAVTTVEDSIVEELKKIPSFSRFIDRGFITVESKQSDADEVAQKGMEKKDSSAQKTVADMKKTSSKATDKVTTNEKSSTK